MQEIEVAFTHYTDFYINEPHKKRLRHQGARDRSRVTSLREFRSVIKHYQCGDVSQVAVQGRHLPMFQSKAIGKTVVRMHSITLELINGQLPSGMQVRSLLEQIGLSMDEGELALVGECYRAGHTFLGTLSKPNQSDGKECLV